MHALRKEVTEARALDIAARCLSGVPLDQSDSVRNYLGPRKLTPDVVGASLSRSSFYRQQQGPQRFKPGDKVRTKNIHPKTHTRLPRYARDKVGVVELCHGCHMYPDSVATDA